MAATPTPPRIHKLSQALINQIAAGEVIERPSSIIKELLENSLDAGATSIEIEIEEGGMRLIRVTDNGHGIHPDDIPLALESHATSKLKSAPDLERIASLGFRGEALPSIAAIAQLKLTSRIAGADRGWAVCMEPATGTTERLPAAHPTGTTVEVRGLFHTTPARKKFLRSDRTEFLHILEMVRRLALSRSGVAVRLRHNGKRVLSCKGTGAGVDIRVAAIMGRSFIRDAIPLEYGRADMRLWGWLGPATLSRSQGDRQYFYLNGRMIRDKRVNHAIRLAYGDEIPAGRYPFYLLYMEMDNAAVDVNVHPCKYEVRFNEPRNVHDFIYAGIHHALQNGVPAGVKEPDAGAAGLSAQLAAPGPSLRHERFMGRVSSNYAALTAQVTGLGRVIGNMHGRFIITERDGDFLLLDALEARQHIAKVRMRLATFDKPVLHRPLLVPVSFTVAMEQADAVERHAGLLSKFGLTMVRSSPVSILIRTLPNFLLDADIRALIPALAVHLRGTDNVDTLEEKLIATIAEHSRHTAGNGLNNEEMAKLLRSFEETGIDVSVESRPPLWRTLDIQTLEVLLKQHG